jgi:RimJ/RimL family protein N-acetyltransferase
MSDPRDLVTARLHLRPLTIDDTAALAAVYAEPTVSRYIGGERLTPESVPAQVAWFADEWDQRGYGQSAVRDRETGEFLGRIGLHYFPDWDEVELGYVLSRSAQGKGLALEGAGAWIDWARAEPTLDRLIANIHPDNAASIGLAQKLGFEFSRHDVTPSGVPTLIFDRDVRA